jgi:hypothetical protein
MAVAVTTNASSTIYHFCLKGKGKRKKKKIWHRYSTKRNVLKWETPVYTKRVWGQGTQNFEK